MTSGIISTIKGKGRVRNHSTKVLWVVESDTNHPHGPAVAHLLGSKQKSPGYIDSDGFKRQDGKSILGHETWWKIYGHITVNIFDYGEKLIVAGFMRRAPKDEFDQGKDKENKVVYDPNPGWGEEMKYIIDANRGKSGTIEEYEVERIGWISKEEAIMMTEQEEIDNAVVVRPRNRTPYLRSWPDKQKSNNFSTMAKN